MSAASLDFRLLAIAISWRINAHHDDDVIFISGPGVALYTGFLRRR